MRIWFFLPMDLLERYSNDDVLVIITATYVY